MNAFDTNGVSKLMKTLLCLLIITAMGCATPPEPAPETHPVSSAQPLPQVRGPGAIILTAAQKCRENLHQLDNAKQRWAVEHRKIDTEVPIDSDLFGADKYMAEKPKCLSGGIYTLGALKETPSCSIPEHSYNLTEAEIKAIHDHDDQVPPNQELLRPQTPVGEHP